MRPVPEAGARPARIALVSDAWLPQINGVTTTLAHCREELERRGHGVELVTPDRFRTIPCPRYPHIRLAVGAGRQVRDLLRELRPDAIHIATEGPLGIAARRFCGRRGIPFTSAFHTRFADYLRVYAGIPKALTYRLQRWFHGGAQRTLVPAASLRRELAARGFEHLVEWMRGVDAELFRPQDGDFYGLPRPIFLAVGRVAAEKNLEAFLDLELPGSKVVVGDGPARPALERAHPGVRVMLEANACGLPVAAYPVSGPLDVVRPGVTGVLDEDLGAACRAALALDRRTCRRHAEGLTWWRCAEMLRDNLAPIEAVLWERV